MQIVPMTSEHADAVLAIFGEGIEFGDATFETAPPSWAEFDAAKLPEHRWVAVEDDGRTVLGWVAASPTSSRHVYRGVVEDALYVRSTARGRGVGRALLQRLVESTEDAGIWTIKAGVFPENAVSIALHTQLGFREVGVQERVGEHHGRWRDVVLLERRSARI